ncbi:MAG: MATE family efflux transporter [Christensenellales bacterium]
MRAHTLDMTVGSPARLLLRFSLPLFVGNLFQQVYNLADTAIAGHLLGDAALSQIGATAALYSLITTLAFGLNSGFALSVSRHFGANDRKRMEQSVCWMVTLSALCAAVMTAVFLLSRFALADAMQIPADTREGALAYLTVILAGIPLTMAYNLESSLMQSVGNSITPLLFLVFSSILNIALDLLFMGPLGLGVGRSASAWAARRRRRCLRRASARRLGCFTSFAANLTCISAGTRSACRAALCRICFSPG